MSDKKKNDSIDSGTCLLDACKAVEASLTKAMEASWLTIARTRTCGPVVRSYRWDEDVVPILEGKLAELRAAIHKAECQQKQKTSAVEDFEYNIFVVSGEFLKKLAAGDMKLEEIVNPENIALMPWSGLDIMEMLKEGSEFMAGRETMPDETDVEDLINDVAHTLSEAEGISEMIYDVVGWELDELDGAEPVKGGRDEAA